MDMRREDTAKKREHQESTLVRSSFKNLGNSLLKKEVNPSSTLRRVGPGAAKRSAFVDRFSGMAPRYEAVLEGACCAGASGWSTVGSNCCGPGGGPLTLTARPDSDHRCSSVTGACMKV